MVARLKLKGIDGRAPPGVNHRSLPQRLCSEKPPERAGLVSFASTSPRSAGDTLKVRGIPKASTTKPVC
jgi:hypothetical protein